MPETNWPDREAYEPGSYKNGDSWLDELMDVVNGWDD